MLTRRASVCRRHLHRGGPDTWTPPTDADVFYSNATFQWIADHMPVLQRLLKALPEGGALAVQMPDNVNEPSHVSMREAAADGPWAAVLKDTPRELLPSVGFITTRCGRIAVTSTSGTRIINIRSTARRPSPTGSRARRFVPFSIRCRKRNGADFLAAYTARLTKAYPPQCDGKSLLRFPRIFLMAVR